MRRSTIKIEPLGEKHNVIKGSQAPNLAVKSSSPGNGPFLGKVPIFTGIILISIITIVGVILIILFATSRLFISHFLKINFSF